MKYVGDKEENVEYRKRPGAYAIIINKDDDKIGIATIFFNRFCYLLVKFCNVYTCYDFYVSMIFCKYKFTYFSLDLLKVRYEIIPSKVDETLEEGLSIIEQSKRLAYIKAKEIFNKTEGDRIIIGSDSMVIKNGKIYGKPKDGEFLEILFRFTSTCLIHILLLQSIIYALVSLLLSYSFLLSYLHRHKIHFVWHMLLPCPRFYLLLPIFQFHLVSYHLNKLQLYHNLYYEKIYRKKGSYKK